ncbi:putative 26S proteasome non-ATPase regulatory subunit 12 [Blattamonas nauphoetae]|uniref:26S proteasome non-ATPase regulatory subunit 12 n=1 Tax=Blattamonas nauphoetae TaxID=2049346 RepID=A0ABQ9Y017_9EUKA|nr:putative 26S proteasome non-ATPase regulatory subunit 12 [Blattamonas nauphoetae]
MLIDEPKGSEKVPVQDVLTRAQSLSQAGDLNGVIQCLTVAERTYRKLQDTESESQVLISICQYLFDAQQFETLNEKVEELTKVRGPLIVALRQMFEHCRTLAKSMDDGDTKGAFMQALRKVTDGNVEYEAVRIDLTRSLSKMYERLGRGQEAVDVLMEIAIETAGTLTREDRAELVIEQMRLNLSIDNFIQAGIQSKKFPLRGTEKYYIDYYSQLLLLHIHERDFLATARDFRSISQEAERQCKAKDKKSIDGKDKEEGWKDEAERRDFINIIHNATTSSALFLLITPYSPEQNGMLLEAVADGKRPDAPILNNLTQSFLKDLLISRPTVEQVFSLLSTECLALTGNIRSLLPQLVSSTCSSVLHPGELSQLIRKELLDRVTEHDLRVIAKFYKRVSMKRLAELLNSTEDITEETVSKLAVDGQIYAKINRPKQFVEFVRPLSTDEVLDDWSNRVSLLLSKVEKVSQLIEKERITCGDHSESSHILS